MRQMQKMGPLKNVLGMLPGVNPQMLQAANVDEKRIKHVEAIVLSMTPRERADPGPASTGRAGSGSPRVRGARCRK